MYQARATRKMREYFFDQRENASSRVREPLRINISPAALIFRQHAVLTTSEWSWFIALSLFTGLVFFANKLLLFTEFNNWALVAYATDFIKASATEQYVVRLLNTPNVLFTMIYVYARDVFPSLNSYTLY